MAHFCNVCGASLDFAHLTDGAYHCPECDAVIQVSQELHGAKSITIAMAPTLLLPSQNESKLLHLGRFQILERIGQGGFGTVYRAHDTQLNRVVALKTPHVGEFVTSEQKALFLREAQKAAALEHPGIVPIFDAGEVSEIPFIVSQFVKGETLGECMSGNRIPYQECALIVSQIADALQHAHERNLVHRDVKPGNIMLGSNRRPLLMDFGLAIDVARDLRVTSDGRIKGTPAYMSPEQASGESHRIDQRTDIYSLGVVLYELLTGERPFHGVHQKVIDQIRSNEPRSLRSFNSKIPIDLQTICQKAMEKDPRRRYQTAQELAEDLRRWLADEPIYARRIGRIGRLARWCRRHPGVTTSISVIFLILSIASMVSLRLYLQEKEALVGERAAVREAIQRASKLSVASAEQFMKNDILTAIPWLVEAYRLDKGDESRESISRLRLQCALRSSPRLESVWFHDAPVTTLEMTRDRRRFASASSDGVIRIWDVATGKQVMECLGHSGSIAQLKFTSDGGHLVSAGTDMTLRVWSIVAGRQVAAKAYPRIIRSMDLDVTGEVIGTAHDDHRVRLWKWRDAINPTLRELDHGADVSLVAFHPHEPRLATGGLSAEIRFWNTETGEESKPGIRHEMGANTLTYSHDGRLLAAVLFDIGFKADLRRQIHVWDAATLKPMFDKPPAIAKLANRLVFSSDDSLISTLASGREKDAVAVCALSDGTSPLPSLDYDGVMSAIDFSPNGTLLATACEDGFVRVWRVRGGGLSGMPLRHAGPVRSARFLDNTHLITCSDDHCVRLWRSVDDNATTQLGMGTVIDAALSSDGRRLVLGSKDRTARVCDLESRSLAPLPELRHKGSVASVAFSPDDNQIATGSADGTAQLWNARNGTPTLAPFSHFSPVSVVRFSPTGDHLVTACRDNAVRVWNCKTGAMDFQLDHPDRVAGLRFSPSGKLLATAGFDGNALLWEWGQGAPPRLLKSLSHPASLSELDFHPTEDLLLTICVDKVLRVWDCATFEVNGSFYGHNRQVRVAKISPDGERVLSLGDDGMMKIWEARTGTEHALAFDLGSKILDVDFGHDGRLIACAGSDRTVRVWDSHTGEPVSPPLLLPEEIFRCFLLSDSRQIAAVTIKGSLFTCPLVNADDNTYDPELEAQLFTAHRVAKGGGAVAIDPGEYRTLANTSRTRIRFPQLIFP